MSKTLLLADDSPTIQRVVALSFAAEDIMVVSVNDGDQAVEALNRSRPDIVLADIGMPGRSGYELAEYMRQTTELASIPVLLLASPFEPMDRTRAQAAGARGVLSKPVNPATLVERVRELLGESAGPPPDTARISLPSPQSPPAASVAPTPDGGHLDDYFEQIDRAFAELKTTRRPPPQPADLWQGELDPGDTRHTGDAVDRLAPAAPPRHGFSLTDAFSALLAAETGDSDVDHLPAAPAIDMDALADAVTARVLATMSDPLLREKITDIVFTTAERLVREEIERIKREVE